MGIIPNPKLIYYLTKYSLTTNRPWKFSYDDMKEYQVNALKRIINYAGSTKLYKEHFKKANISSEDIKCVDDLQKLPFITKQNFRDYGTNGTLPNNFNIKKGFKVDTSGSTGKPVSIYRNLKAIAREQMAFTRIYKAYDLKILKTRVTNIGDFSIPNSYDKEVVHKGLMEKMGFLSNSFKKYVQHLYAGESIGQLMKKLESFNPELILAYPGTLIGLMKLKNEGQGENLHPKYVVISGGVLDSYTKKQFENTFDTRVLSFYGATESGAVAFECLHGGYHIQSDLIMVEAVDKDGMQVSSGEMGHLVLTRLYGGGTPIIRYTGMDDIITLLDYEECDCGMHTQLLKNVEGRTSDSIVLPDGRIFPPATFTLIPGEVSQETGVDIVQRFQIIQNKKDEIEILVVINNRLREKVESADKVLNEIKKRYQKVVGKDVNIIVREVDKVKEDRHSPNSLSSIVISNVKHTEWF